MAKPKDQKETREKLFGRTLPELPATEDVADKWFRLGCARDGIAGAVPFDWQEVLAFATLTQCAISPCEAECLVDMSRAYCAAVRDDNPLSKSPMERRA